MTFPLISHHRCLVTFVLNLLMSTTNMFRIAIVTLLAFEAAALAQSPSDDPTALMRFVGPRKDVDNNAVLDIPNEPTGNYNTLLKREVLPYGASNPWHNPPYYAIFTHYDASLCGRMCSSVTNSAQPTYPFTENAKPICNMLVVYELQMRSSSQDHTAGEPISMVCELYSSVWSSHYQTVQEVAGFVASRPAVLRPAKVSIYDREDYSYPPICAMREPCGKDYYAGGDCSGWGGGHC